jgi:hypothetical protein
MQVNSRPSKGRKRFKPRPSFNANDLSVPLTVDNCSTLATLSAAKFDFLGHKLKVVCSSGRDKWSFPTRATRFGEFSPIVVIVFFGDLYYRSSPNFRTTFLTTKVLTKMVLDIPI